MPFREVDEHLHSYTVDAESTTSYIGAYLVTVEIKKKTSLCLKLLFPVYID